jgi:hypothetical protein
MEFCEERRMEVSTRIHIQTSSDRRDSTDDDTAAKNWTSAEVLLQYLATLPTIYHEPSKWLTELNLDGMKPISTEEELFEVNEKSEGFNALTDIIPDVPIQRAFYIKHLKSMPNVYAKVEATQMTWLYFSVASLDLLNTSLETIQGTDTLTMKDIIIAWVYAQQVGATSTCNHATGFRGSASSGENTIYNEGNLASTYSALAILRICGNDYSQVDKQGIIATIKKLQSQNGCFFSSIHNGEQDLRYIYCACAISALLNDWSGVDCVRAASYIAKCQQYDGAFGLTPGNEGHGLDPFRCISFYHICIMIIIITNLYVSLDTFHQYGCH